MLRVVDFFALSVEVSLPKSAQSGIEADERPDHLVLVLHLRELCRKQRLLRSEDFQIGGRAVVHQLGSGCESLLQGVDTDVAGSVML